MGVAGGRMSRRPTSTTHISPRTGSISMDWTYCREEQLPISCASHDGNGVSDPSAANFVSVAGTPERQRGTVRYVSLRKTLMPVCGGGADHGNKLAALAVEGTLGVCGISGATRAESAQ